MFEVGSVIAGKLRIERILGQGGMGVVAEATHLHLDQRVAVKIMRDHVASDPSTVERFIREARAAAKLKSEHVCRVTDVGQLESGAPYIVMELLAGVDLAHLVAREPLPIATAVDHVMQACIAIAEAHVRGIVHRDLKPANLFLSKGVGGAPLVKVLDFGIAKVASKTDAGLTMTDSVMGSPGYMSPEQLRSSKDVDARTDIWALGVILYQLVSGRLPFPATSIGELAMKVGMDPPDPIETDEALRAVILRCLEKTPNARFANVAALARALAPLGTESAKQSLAVIERITPKDEADAFGATMPVVDAKAVTGAVDAKAQTIAGGSVKTVTTLRGATASVETPTAAPVRSRGLVYALGLVAVGGVATAVVLATNRDETNAPAPAPPPIAAIAPTDDAPPPPPIATVDASVVEEQAPPADAAVSRGDKKSPVASLVAKLDTAIAAKRCREAEGYYEKLKYSGTPPDVMESVGPRVNDCGGAQADALIDPAAPGAVRILLVRWEEQLEAKLPQAAREEAELVLRTLPDNVEVRTFAVRAACLEKNGDAAREHAAKLPAGRAPVAVCAKRGIDLTGKKAGEPTPDPPADWKQQLGEAMMVGDYKEARDLALLVLAKTPNDQYALQTITGAYCLLEDAPNAKKYAAKLDAKRLAEVKERACVRVHIDLSK